MNKEMKKTMLLSIVGVLTLITLVVGATYAYFKAQGGTGGSSDVNVITATTDLLTFKIDKAINISISQSELKKGGTDVSDSTGAHATLTASNSKNVEKTTRSYNIYFVIDTNDFEYTTQDGTPELYLNVTDPNGNNLENITGLVHYDKGFDITTRTGGFLLVPDYDIEATRGNTITQDWKVEVTFANLDTDQSKNMGKSLSGKLFVTSDKMNSYELSKITNMTTKTTYNSIDTTLDVEKGSADINKYYYGIEKTSSNVTGYVNNSGVKKVALKDVNFVETDKNTYKFDNLSDNSVYKVYSYGIDKNGIKTNLYETEVTTNEYNNPVVNSVSHTSTLNSITLSVNATKGDNDIVKYYYSKDNGSNYVESASSSYTFSNLTSDATFYVRVYVKDNNNRTSSVSSTSIKTKSNSLASYIKSKYTSQGANGLYYHDSSLTNGAGDNSYRYAGPSSQVNNYVCLAMSGSSCPDDRLFRIIGVFGDQVKVIKATSAGNRPWGNNNTWSTSSINSYLNGQYLNNLKNIFNVNKIVNTTWRVGGYVEEKRTLYPPAGAYQKEYVRPVSTNTTDGRTTYDAQIGLMYISDYGFAASPSAWTTDLYEYDSSSIPSNNWLYTGDYEYTITRAAKYSDKIFGIFKYGLVSSFQLPNNNDTFRPTFYLSSSALYVSGTGTLSNPYTFN